MKKQTLTIGLFGFGCVGYGLYQVLGKTNGIQASIKKVCVKHAHKSRPVKDQFFTLDPDEVLLDPDINIIVELTDDADAAFQIVKTALQNGKAVVTANKKMVSEHFAELIALQEQYQLPVLYEAAACASIPIIRNLEEYYDNDTLGRIEGIVNGSTNFMLSKAQDEHLDFGEALNIAQTLGYAESNPSLDVDGYDAAYKLQIICAHAFGLIIDARDIARIGIRAIGKEEFKYAREKGYKIKLVAQAYKTSDNAIAAFVMPKFVNEQSPLFRVDDVFNGVITETAFADRQFFFGKGAGAYPTASAVLSDISALSYQYRYEYKKLQSGSVGELEQNGSLQVYVRVPYELARIAHSVFDSIDVIQQDKQGLCLTGLANVRSLCELAGNFPEAAIVLLEDVHAMSVQQAESLEHSEI